METNSVEIQLIQQKSVEINGNYRISYKQKEFKRNSLKSMETVEFQRNPDENSTEIQSM